MSNQGYVPEARASAQDLYRLRQAQHVAEQKALLAQLAQNRVKAILLELERKYGLLATESSLDIRTGRIIKEGSGGEP